MHGDAFRLDHAAKHSDIYQTQLRRLIAIQITEIRRLLDLLDTEIDAETLSGELSVGPTLDQGGQTEGGR